MPKRLVSGTDETSVSIQIDNDIVNLVIWHDYEEIHTETMTLERFKRNLGL
jgi:hypothetical protein